MLVCWRIWKPSSTILRPPWHTATVLDISSWPLVHKGLQVPWWWVALSAPLNHSPQHPLFHLPLVLSWVQLVWHLIIHQHLIWIAIYLQRLADVIFLPPQISLITPPVLGHLFKLRSPTGSTMSSWSQLDLWKNHRDGSKTCLYVNLYFEYN